MLPTSAAADVGVQQLGIPAYVHPRADLPAWNRVIGSAPGKVGMVVANVLNGPDYQPLDYWTSVIHGAHSAGMRVLGYVDTGYFGTTGQPTRLGSTSPEDWMAQIEQDIAAWYAFYGADIDGIFFDQGQNACGPTAGSETWADLYRDVNRYEKMNHPGAFTVLNPGTVVPQCYEDSADVLLTFEGSYAAYVGSDPNPALDYQPLNWQPSDPSKIWHIVYAASQDKLAGAISLSTSRGAGYVYVTDDVLENPYDSVPLSPYWDLEQADVAGGSPAPASVPPVVPPGWSAPEPSVPLNLMASKTRYTSTKLQWDQSTVGVTAGYDVYANGSKILTLPSSTNKILVGGLMPTSTTIFTVQARNASGNTSAPSDGVTVTTRALPDGLSLTNPTVMRQWPQITYSADFLMPFSFHRIFISTGSASNACWLTGSVPPSCADYLIENSSLLKYAGTGGAWTWKKVRTVVPVVNRYTYTWTISRNDIVSDVHSWAWGTVFNAEGYAPLTYAPVIQ